MTKSISCVIAELKDLLRQKFDRLGIEEGVDGTFIIGPVPTNPRWEAHQLAHPSIFYAGLDDKGIEATEAESARYIPEPYKEFLRQTNGGRILGISLHGTIGGFIDRSGVSVGQPISICYQNEVERPDYIPNGHLGIGAINGDWYSQGHLYLTSAGEVELYHSLLPIIGARWNSLQDFLTEETQRRLSFFDDQGLLRDDVKYLPGDTDSWEKLAEDAKQKRSADERWVQRILGKFR